MGNKETYKDFVNRVSDNICERFDISKEELTKEKTMNDIGFIKKTICRDIGCSGTSDNCQKSCGILKKLGIELIIEREEKER